VDFFDRLDAARERWNVLRHPFYGRWSAGGLTREELAFYAGEYRHAVVALAEASGRAADVFEGGLRAELEQHAAEERAHVGLWDRFADALQADTQREPLTETMECARAWRAASDALEGLAVLYAVEANQPAISRTKLAGLERHYGLPRESPATGYFTVHAERDHEHAALSRAALEERGSEIDGDRLAGIAEAALAGNWRLLDGVEESAAGGRH
jgi:pyrroloquinoline-quinone synthase